MTVKFFPNDKGNPAGKVADASCTSRAVRWTD